MITILIFGVFIAFVSRWWSQYSQRAARVAELQAIAMNRHPILIISRFIGDSQVEADAEYLRAALKEAKNPYLTPSDVHVAIYTATAGPQGKAFITFNLWQRIVLEEHDQRVAQWESKALGNRTNQLTDHGRYTLHGQQAPSVDPMQWKHVTSK